MPRNRKRKHRLTKREIRDLRNFIRGGAQEEALAQDTSESFQVLQSQKDSLPSVLHIARKSNTHSMVFTHFYPSIRNFFLGTGALGFTTEADLNTYEQWYAEYIKKYGDNPEFEFPPPTDGVYPAMEPAVNYKNSNSPRKALIGNSRRGAGPVATEEMTNWLWCLETCEDEVRYMGNYFFFASVEDAALFRITNG